MRQALSLLGLLGILIVAMGCDARTPSTRDAGGDGAVSPTGCTIGAPGVRCIGAEAILCHENGEEGSRTDCSATGQVCADSLGCRMCRPNSFNCNGNDVQRCSVDGTAWETIATCDAAAGQACNSLSGSCRSACEDAAASDSYIGCEYWPTPVANGVSQEFQFAVVVANPQTAPANVTVTRNGLGVATVTVPPGGLQTIPLDWLEYTTPSVGGDIFTPPTTVSSLTRGGAYRLQSTLPVTVYQFSPLEYQLTPGCTSPDCFSYSNDASLLLPTHVLTGNYIAISERTLGASCSGSVSSSPGFFTLVSVSPSPVQVTVNLAGNIAASADGAVAAATAGSTQSYTMNQGDVLQLASADITTCVPGGTTAGQCGGGLSDMTHCRVPDQFDLTGTGITATGPVMVIGGHTCAFIPFNRFACDHIEETIFPLEAWGSDFAVSMAQPLRGEPNVIRVISGADGNTITFDPASVQGPTTLNRGQVLEFEARQDFRVSGSGPMTVAQFLVGQNYDGAVELEGAGDPSMSFAIPTLQFRDEYTFLAPATFEQSFVNVVAPAGAVVMLSSNGGPATQVTGFTPIGASGLSAARISIPGGAHRITSTVGFGIVVYGYGSYTSYMYPGGLNFGDINPLI